MYHSGETRDLSWLLEELQRRFPARALGAVGFSLGGNVLLKYLAEHDAPCLLAAVAVSVPFDLAAGATWIERGFSRVYRRYLVRKLASKVRAKRELLERQVDVKALLAARTFWEFDDRGTAPLHGFRDARDYYERSSSGPLLGNVCVPTLVIHSRDDPFVPASAIPESLMARNPLIDARISETGGHVGFVAGPPWAPVFWAERTTAEFLAERLNER